MFAPSQDIETILVVDDDAGMRSLVATALVDSGYRVLEAASGAGAVAVAAALQPDLIVLDVELGDMHGLAVCRELRLLHDVPIIGLSAHHGERDKIAMLNAGADDYVTKPFSLGEFSARVAAQLRRAAVYSGRRSNAPIVIGDVRIDFDRRRVSRAGAVIQLTPVEWRLLGALADSPGRVVPHREIFEAVWGRAFGRHESCLRVHITHLRRKLELNPASPTIILTEPGFGYRLDVRAGVGVP